MTLDDVKKIIKEENLILYNLDKNQPLREEQAVLRFEDDEGYCLLLMNGFQL